MADPVTAARTARESLAKGLQALQSDPTVPRHLIELAAPIAQAMGALHQIEKSGGTQLQPHADIALNNTRGALSQLQSNPNAHAAVSAALEAVAASLGQVHQLAKMAQGPGQAVPPPQQQAPAQPQQRSPSQPNFQGAPPQQQPPVQQQPQQRPPQQQQPPVQQPMQQPQQRAPQQGFGAPPAGPQAFGPPGGAAQADPFRQQAPAPQPPVQNPFGAPQQQQAPIPGPGGVHLVNADLGAHSVTNFYKGLSGNDIIDHGGLFVSTYMVPKIGTQVRLKVSLPGGYEFEANAVVKWAREASESSDAPPGFGAQFTQITPEARQLVYRYVRNREPIFHDDL